MLIRRRNRRLRVAFISSKDSVNRLDRPLNLLAQRTSQSEVTNNMRSVMSTALVYEFFIWAISELRFDILFVFSLNISPTDF